MDRFENIFNEQVANDICKFLVTISTGSSNTDGNIEEKIGNEINNAIDKIEFYKNLPNEKVDYFREGLCHKRMDSEDEKSLQEMELFINELQYGAQVGQIMFHGGSWPKKYEKYREIFLTDRILSTSLSPEIAVWHALNSGEGDGENNVWVLNVVDCNLPTYGMYLPYKGEKKHELEFLFDKTALVKLKFTKEIEKIKYFFADIY